MYEKKAFRVTSQKQINQIKNNKGEIIETQKKNKNPRNLSLDNKHVIVCDFLCVYRSLCWNIRPVDFVWLFTYSKT